MTKLYAIRTTVRAWGVCALFAAALFLVPGPLQGDLSKFRMPSYTLSLFTLPGQSVSLDLGSYAGMSRGQLQRLHITPGDVTVKLTEDGLFRLTPPRIVGIHSVRFQNVMPEGAPAAKAFTIQVVVMRPASDLVGGELNGYPVGTYPMPSTESKWQYEPPAGFVEITELNRETPISDHFVLGDLDCKLEAPYPHYASIHTSLLVKLEGLVDELNRRGMRGDALRIMSGYRTPDYNRSIGNRTRFSRHVLGDAADVFIDADADDTMDDLTGDGQSTHRDALALYRVVEEMDNSAGYAPLVGGASAYRPNSSHGPFVHLDTRGYPARW